jgi:hypothetical protein
LAHCSSYFLRESNYRHGYSFSLVQASDVFDQRRELVANVGLNDLLTALKADASANGFDNDRLTTKPLLTRGLLPRSPD